MHVCSPKPEELWENGSDEAINEDVRPHHLAGKLEGLEARVMEQEEAGPQQQQVEQAHKPWREETFCQSAESYMEERINTGRKRAASHL